MEYILVSISFAVGFLAAWLIASNKQMKLNKIYESNEKLLIAEKAELEIQKSVAMETIRIKMDDIIRLQSDLTEQTTISNTRGMKVAALNAINDNLAEKLENQKSEIVNLQNRLTSEFENIATKILKERADDFSLSNNKNISDILNPLKEKIQLFEKKSRRDV